MEFPDTSRISSAQKTLSHVYGFNSLMEENYIMLVYCGEFSQELNKTLLAFTERKFKADNVEDNTRRKVFNIMVEVLQNISKNKIEKTGSTPDIESVFMLGANTEHFLIISSNLIRNEKIETLKNRIDQVNSLDKEGLKNLYKDVRLNSNFSDKSGAGIGIIDIARKSENRLEYSFEQKTDEFSMFSLLIKINK